MNLETLCRFSHKYGANPEFVLAGGGNTSAKNAKTLVIKGSGSALATIEPDQFVKLDRAKLNAMWDKTYPEGEAEREAAVLADLMAARAFGEEKKRPSVETLLHNLFPQTYVLHVHPAIVNAITCSKKGKETIAKLFPEAVWGKSTRPGYTLAALCKKELASYEKKNGKPAELLFLQNHGVFFAADSEKDLTSLVSRVMTAIKAEIKIRPDFTAAPFDADEVTKIAPALRMLYGKGKAAVAHFVCNKQVLAFAESEKAFKPLTGAFTPDHIVYCKANPLYLTSTDVEEAKKAFDAYEKKYGVCPKIVFVEKLGMFALASTRKEAETVKNVWLDAIKIAVLTGNFGGPLAMEKELVDFITGWEVESYRAKIANASDSAKRIEGKISLVTGSAQGFGKGIAEAMAAEGAYVVIADMNEAGAKATAAEICEKYGSGKAIAVAANVSDEASVKAMFNAVVCEYGGLDVFVNNAGIARAGGLDEMTKSTFELVTAVNYTAYFLCTKYASAIMKTQHEILPSYMQDIIEINSKSGLDGSKKNFAYAGSKFGGIGLTQSFAMELAEYNIKVNAVCPGNFLNGPLWSDPVKGLFVQYLNAGKVPGAKTVDDVRRYYESKVPLGRGCEVVDVTRAIFYIIEQEYETGQAVPVTGGQSMLK